MTTQINGMYVLEKFPGKGGWTYAEIPEIKQDKTSPFGWVKVSGSIDGYLLRQYKLMPMGEGRLFLPVKAAIRKKIKKEAGDTVHIVLEPDNSPTEIPTELMDCFNMEDEKIFKQFKAMSEGNQKAYIDWIYAAKTEETKTARIVKMMYKVEQNLGFYEGSNT